MIRWGGFVGALKSHAMEDRGRGEWASLCGVHYEHERYIHWEREENQRPHCEKCRRKHEAPDRQ